MKRDLGSNVVSQRPLDLETLNAALTKLVQQAYFDGHEEARLRIKDNDAAWNQSDVKALLEKLTGSVIPRRREHQFFSKNDIVCRQIETDVCFDLEEGPLVEKEFFIRVEGRRYASQEQVAEVAALIANLLNLFYDK
jgi:hypothetical protein